MKPIHIGFLIAAGTLGGAMFVKLTQHPQPAPVPETVATAAPVSAPAEPQANEAQPLPSPFLDETSPAEKKPASKETKPAKARKESKTRPAETTVAQNQPPAVTQTPAPAPTPAPAEPAPAPTQAPAPAAPSQPEVPAPPPPPQPHHVTVAAGTTLPVRLVEGLSSERNQPGDTFTATLEEPLVVDGFVIAERGARLEGRVQDVQQAGRVKGVASLSISLTQLHTSDGQKVGIQTDTFTKEGLKTVKQDAAKIGAAAGIGAAIGAIAGGGKGAAIGAAVGGAAGTGGVIATRGKPATLATETRLNFRISEPVTLTERLQH